MCYISAIFVYAWNITGAIETSEKQTARETAAEQSCGLLTPALTFREPAMSFVAWPLILLFIIMNYTFFTLK